MNDITVESLAKAIMEQLDRYNSDGRIKLMRGKFRNHGAIAITQILGEFLRELEAVNHGALCVLDWTDQEDVDEDNDYNSIPWSLDIYLRLEALGIWLHSRMEGTKPDGDLDEDENESYLPEELPDYVMRSATLDVALAPGFAQFRNREQRSEFALKLLCDKGDGFDYSYWAPEIARRAESWLDFAVLPTAVKGMQADGKSIKQISETLGITAARVKRAAGTIVSADMAQALEEKERIKGSAADGK